MIKFILTTVLIVASSSLHAHEGDHDAPGVVKPPKGGITRTLETIHLELLPQGKIVKIFVYDRNLKPAEAKDYPVSATATRPRKKSEKIELVTKKNHWEFKYDAKGAHRYMLQLTIKQGGHKDKIKWNIEPGR